ncbi:MAG: DUF4395 family protein [Candidatus Pacebacteria bacterium]|nr:DUF4395 family protein [Candidatus Paceibacterota bacterium]
MQQCSFLNDSSRFSKLIYGSVILTAFLVRSKWLVLIVSVLMCLNAFSVGFSIPCRIYSFTEKYLFKRKIGPLQKEPGELRFSYAMASVLIFVGFLLLQFTKYTVFAWMYILIVAFMLFIACFIGFCVATLMYVAFKRFLESVRNNKKYT